VTEIIIAGKTNESLVLFSSEATTYQITAQNPSDEATASVTVEVIKQITIISPLNGVITD